MYQVHQFLVNICVLEVVLIIKGWLVSRESDHRKFSMLISISKYPTGNYSSTENKVFPTSPLDSRY